MKVLFVGGTGIISTDCVRRALSLGYEVTVLNRGTRVSIDGTRSIVADINDLDTARSVLQEENWYAVADFTVFTPTQLESRIELFSGKTRQYLFVSTASAYQKPVRNYKITEETPLENPFWQYSRDKARCEEILMAAFRKGRLPVTIVRPSLTYGGTHVPLVMNSWQLPYTIVDRIRKDLPVVVPGDGTSLWTITHSSDFAKGFVGLLGNADSVGEAFHITSDEVLTWDQLFLETASAAGVAEPKLVHIASDFIAACLPDKMGSLLGDKAVSVVFDNSKIKRFVPEYEARTSFAQGIRMSIENMDSDENLRGIDSATNEELDKLISTYQYGLAVAKASFVR